MSAQCAVWGARGVVSGATSASDSTTSAKIHFTLEESLEFVDARVLVVVDPANTVEVAHGAHVFGQFLRFWPREVVDYRNDVALRLQSGDDFLKKKRINY
jgi:hypothetical protein